MCFSLRCCKAYHVETGLHETIVVEIIYGYVIYFYRIVSSERRKKKTAETYSFWAGYSWDIRDPDVGISRTKTLCKWPLSVVLDREWPGWPGIWVWTSRIWKTLCKKTLGLILPTLNWLRINYEIISPPMVLTWGWHDRASNTCEPCSRPRAILCLLIKFRTEFFLEPGKWGRPRRGPSSF